MENTLVSSTIIQHSIEYDLKKMVVNNNSTTATNRKNIWRINLQFYNE